MSKKTTKTPMGFRLSSSTAKQLFELSSALGITKTQVVELAVLAMHQKHIDDIRMQRGKAMFEDE